MEFADIHLSYEFDILGCADACARFNQDASSSVFCEAASLDVGTIGPSGVDAGYTCWLKQNSSGLVLYNGTTNGSGVTTTATHTVQLISTPPITPVCLPHSCYSNETETRKIWFVSKTDCGDCDRSGGSCSVHVRWRFWYRPVVD